MRIGLVVFALASVAAFTVAIADSVDTAAVNGPDASAVDAAAPQVESATSAAEAAPATTAVAAPDAATAAAGTEAAPAPAASATPQEAADSQPITLKMATVPPPADFKVPAGYRAVKRGLDTVYCKTITPIGTRMPQTYCMSREQVEQIERQAEVERQMLKEKARTGGTSGG